MRSRLIPLYEYQCQSCHKTFEQIHSFRDARLDQACPCGGNGKRKISVPLPAHVAGGTFAQKAGLQTLGDFPDHGNEWIDS
jgi:putative FmdB family regulatory protein